LEGQQNFQGFFDGIKMAWLFHISKRCFIFFPYASLKSLCQAKYSGAESRLGGRRQADAGRGRLSGPNRLGDLAGRRNHAVWLPVKGLRCLAPLIV
jgi:hypothetical protein